MRNDYKYMLSSVLQTASYYIVFWLVSVRTVCTLESLEIYLPSEAPARIEQTRDIRKFGRSSTSLLMSSDSVNEKLDAAETGYGSIKDEPKAGGGLKLIVIGMLIGTFIGVVGTMALISPHSPLAQFQEDQGIACQNGIRTFIQCKYTDHRYLCQGRCDSVQP